MATFGRFLPVTTGGIVQPSADDGHQSDWSNPTQIKCNHLVKCDKRVISTNAIKWSSSVPFRNLRIVHRGLCVQGIAWIIGGKPHVLREA